LIAQAEPPAKVQALEDSAAASREYWTRYNITNHKIFESAEDSLRALSWRNAQYFDYDRLMPVHSATGKVVLDYGCGPGHDLVGFGTNSRPFALLGADVSIPSLNEAKQRLTLHGLRADLVHVGSGLPQLPFDDASIDLIHCSGVLHHIAHPEGVLAEFKRLLKPGGIVQLMTYNYFSIWMHLYAAFVFRFETPEGKGVSVEDAFRRSTDTPDCPTSIGWRPTDVVKMCSDAGFVCDHIGNATAVRELELLIDARFRAIACQELEIEHRDFLRSLTFDSRGVAFFKDKAAGIDACFRIKRD
jgi:ubiquinone/menaquinone biosynthesis C-methylase UbiE